MTEGLVLLATCSQSAGCSPQAMLAAHTHHQVLCRQPGLASGRGWVTRYQRGFFEKPDLLLLFRLIALWFSELRITCWLVLVEGQNLIAISGKCLWL